MVSHFGSGVITFTVPFLFRTPPGINLWVKGPANWIKDGVQALEGVVETDWLASTFTMNWKMTRVCEWVRFEKGEPFCMLVPVPRGLIETLVPRAEPIVANPELLVLFQRLLCCHPGLAPEAPTLQRLRVRGQLDSATPRN